MTRRKKLIIAIFIVITVLGLLFYFFGKKPVPTPTPKGELKLLETSPNPGKAQILHPTTGIIFTFDGPIVISSVDIVVDPTTAINTELLKGSTNSLVISPKETWEINTKYTIIIKKGLLSGNNKELKEDFSYEIEFTYPEDVITF